MKKSEQHSFMNSSPWYAEGLHFICTGCGACCTGSGRVWLSEQEIMSMAQNMVMKVDEFVEFYLERVEGRWAIRENPQNGDCHFLKEGKCTIYQHRPRQCRTFPWWPSTLESKASWLEAKRVCEGIEATNAPLIPLEEIKRQLTKEKLGRKNNK